MNLAENLEKANDQPPVETTKPRYFVRDAAYALQPRPPLEWVIENLITAGSVSIFYGEPGSKKTYSMLSLAVCVGLGKAWLGFNVNKGKVLIIDEESGEDRLSLRLAAAIRGELGDENTSLEYVSLANFKLDDATDSEMVENLIIERGAKLVIIDALADVMEGDENSKQDTQPVLTTLRRIAEGTKAAIIVIHHSNKTGGYRGSSAIKGSVDLMVQVDSDIGVNWVHFKSIKNRDGDAITWEANATWTEDQFYLTIGTKQEQPKERPTSENYVLEYLREHGESDIESIENNADVCTAKAATAAVYRLAKEKQIYRTNKGGRGVKATYAIKEEEK